LELGYKALLQTLQCAILVFTVYNLPEAKQLITANFIDVNIAAKIEDADVIYQ